MAGCRSQCARLHNRTACRYRRPASCPGPEALVRRIYARHRFTLVASERCHRDLARRRATTDNEAYGMMKPLKRAVVLEVNPLFAIAAFTSGILFTITVTGPANSTICGSPSPKAGGNVQ